MECDIRYHDLIKIYEIDDLELKPFEPYREDMDHCRGYDKSLGYCINLLSDKKTVLDPPMRLVYCCNGKDKIVKIDYVRFLPHIKGSDKKYYSKIFENEKIIYKEKGYSKMILSAISDGIIVWPKLGYEFIENVTKNLILDAIEIYVHKIKGDKEFDIDDYDTIASIDTRYLRDDVNMDFTDWFKDRSYIIQPHMEYIL